LENKSKNKIAQFMWNLRQYRKLPLYMRYDRILLLLLGWYRAADWLHIYTVNRFKR